MSVAIDRLLPYAATLLRREQTGPDDEYGNPTWLEVGEPVRVEIQANSQTEDLDGAVQITAWRVFLPPTVPPAGWDGIRLDTGPLAGETFELVGDAAPYAPAVSGALHHFEVNVRRTR